MLGNPSFGHGNPSYVPLFVTKRFSTKFLRLKYFHVIRNMYTEITESTRCYWNLVDGKTNTRTAIDTKFAKEIWLVHVYWNYSLLLKSSRIVDGKANTYWFDKYSLLLKSYLVDGKTYTYWLTKNWHTLVMKFGNWHQNEIW